MVTLRRQTGVGMIEVLVALLISAIALLGLAGLQITSLKYQKMAHFRALASQSSADMADRIRANPMAVKEKNYVTGEKFLANAKPKSKCVNSGSVCTAQQIAKVDIYNWRRDLSRSLTNGWGDITSEKDAAKNDTGGLILTVYFSETNKCPGGDCERRVDPLCTAKLGNFWQELTLRCFKTVFVP
ncbi:type IV pilus modification protein PilV [Glaciimonas sp. PAMC28666]|uniref:type IV pilus modification protein PilV n=1 Tax=Glaciimonas sp. PAMC28666 TaxID=2807626 RepID=UPI00196302F0|nr:type IV pilus modification protein PilV [Glaciimonas sp. PAMC28666]QRX81270.1 type IV pilus modification protein PilV [Glaciimonas sp. PAMC28666]